MLKLTLDNEATNKVAIPITKDGITQFCQVLIDLHSGEKILLSNFTLEDKNGCVTTIEQDTTALFQFENLKYLVVELPAISSNTDEALASLKEHMISYFPLLYKETLSNAVSCVNFRALLEKRTLILFQFKENELEVVSTIPYNRTIEEYVEQVSLHKNMLNNTQSDGLVNLFNDSKTNTHLLHHKSYYSYYGQNNCNNNKITFFVKNSYIRINAIEINKDKVSITMRRSWLTGSYNSNAGYINLISAIINPSSVAPTFSRLYLGNAILTVNGNVNIALTKQIYPVVVEDPSVTYQDSNNVFLELSDKDGEFLEAIKIVDPSLIYTKHKELLVYLNKSEVRGCKAVYNSSKTLKIVIREEKKKLSDEEAYKSRIFRDYLSHAISLIAIPIFQKEFVIPECLQQHFVFKMASIHGVWYRPPYTTKQRYSERYFRIFEEDMKNQSWKKPEVPKVFQVKTEAVETFIKDYKKMLITSTTQSRSSVFTRHFVEPYVEKSQNSYAQPSEACVFGWMMNIDNQYQNTWNYKLTDSHLLRSSARCGHFYHECGLVSDRTFGIQAILSNVFTKGTYNEAAKEYSIQAPHQYFPVAKKPQFISAVLDIYTANFTPNDEVEKAMRSFGSLEYATQLARVNQLLFLSEDSLNIFKALYGCNTFEDLRTCLDLCMPICLEILETLEYSEELKAHVSSMLNYFWNTTVAISEGFANDAIEK